METAILTGKSKKDIQLLLTIAEKMGIKARFLSEEDLEDFGMGKAIEEGRTGELIDMDDIMDALK